MTDIRELKLGFIGAGNMAYALVFGFITHGQLDPQQIVVSAPSSRNLPKFSKLGCLTTNGNTDLLPEGTYCCDIVFLCVKPQLLQEIAEQTAFLHYNSWKPLILVSVVAGVDLNRLEQLVVNRAVNGAGGEPPALVIYRSVPNTACGVGRGVWCVCRKSHSQHDSKVLSLLSTVALVEFVPENLMDAVVGVSGSGIAFGYEFIQSLADGGVKMGLQRSLATKLAAQTLMGAASMVLSLNRHPIELRDEVCSPAGTTIHGIHALKQRAVAAGIIEAVQASAERSKQLNTKIVNGSK